MLSWREKFRISEQKYYNTWEQETMSETTKILVILDFILAGFMALKLSLLHKRIKKILYNAAWN